MSNDLTNPFSGKNTDLSETDRQRIAKYEEEGMPGLYDLSEASVAKCLDLYLSGKTYGQISSILRIKKPIILYLSKKFNWYAIKQEYFVDLEAHIRDRIMESKISSQDFLLQLTQFWQTKIGRRVNKFLASGDEADVKGLDLKEVDRYFKAIEILQKLSDGRIPTDKVPAVGLNLGAGVTVKKVGDNEVEITPKQKAVSEVLSQLANARREEENKKNQKSDINKETTGEEDDN